MPELSTILLFVISLGVVAFIAYKLGASLANLRWQKKIPLLQKSTADRQRAGIKGKLTEMFAPFLAGFPFKASECKFLGDPIDYVVFEGLDERDVKAIRFVEVKEGTSKLSKHQKQIKQILDSLNSEDVSFETFNFNSEETDKI